jgi:hypothetical protein
MGKKRDDEDLADVEVERMPDLDGWEYFKAVDGALERERWTLAIQNKQNKRSIEYALWTDIKGDPAAVGVLEAHRETNKRWARAVRRAIESSEGGSLDNDARAEVALAILKQHDPTLDQYEDRLLFTLEPTPEEDDEDEDDDSDEDEDDDD